MLFIYYSIVFGITKQMDKSLGEILEITNIIHNNILENKSSITLNEYINHLKQLQTFIRHIRFIANRIEQIYYSCSKEIYSNLQNINIKVLSNKQKSRIGTNNWNKDIMGKNNTNDKKTIISNIKTKVKYVDNINDIPNTQIYWIKDLQQFAIRINDVIIRGNLGNIYGSYNTSHNISKRNSFLSMINDSKINQCSYGSQCEKLKNNKCEFYHDPIDLLKIGKSIDTPIIRNFTSLSWIYTHYNNKKNKYMRHIGSKDSLLLDINKLKRNKRNYEIETNKINNQCMHDILTLIVINNN